MPKLLTLKNFFLFPQPNDDPKLSIDTLQEWLAKLLLHGKDSRNRTRFNKLINDRVIEIDEEKKRLLEDNATKKNGKIVYQIPKLRDEKIVKDKDGNPILEDTTTPPQGPMQFKLSKEAEQKFWKEFNTFLNEDLILDITPSTSEIIHTVRDIILDTKEEFQGRMAMRYDEVCQAFENIKEEKKDDKKETKKDIKDK